MRVYPKTNDNTKETTITIPVRVLIEKKFPYRLALGIILISFELFEN